MRRRSKKTAKRVAECKQFRDQLIASVGHCEICHYIPGKHWRWPSGLSCHEIARGTLRLKSLDKRFATLILCSACHEDVDDTKAWPQARQLAVLRKSRPQDFDLEAFSRLVGYGPERITVADIDKATR